MSSSIYSNNWPNGLCENCGCEIAPDDICLLAAGEHMMIVCETCRDLMESAEANRDE